MKIKFKENTYIELVTSFDEDNDTIETKEEIFDTKEIHEVDLINSCGNDIDIQFGDGSCCYSLSKDLIEIIEE